MSLSMVAFAVIVYGCMSITFARINAGRRDGKEDYKIADLNDDEIAELGDEYVPYPGIARTKTETRLTRPPALQGSSLQSSHNVLATLLLWKGCPGGEGFMMFCDLFEIPYLFCYNYPCPVQSLLPLNSALRSCPVKATSYGLLNNIEVLSWQPAAMTRSPSVKSYQIYARYVHSQLP